MRKKYTCAAIILGGGGGNCCYQMCQKGLKEEHIMENERDIYRWDCVLLPRDRCINYIFDTKEHFNYIQHVEISQILE